MIVPQLGPAGQRLIFGGDEAHHAAAVKRVRPGEDVELLDGRGGVAAARVERIEPGSKRMPAALAVEIRSVRVVAPVDPQVHVYAPAPKGDRLSWMVEQLTQAGAASWTPLRTARSISEPGAARRDRLERIAAESLKQCGRAWAMPIAEECDLAGAISRQDQGPLVYGDAAGGAASATSFGNSARLVIGPEGGFTADEVASLLAAGAAPARFGPHIMRIETAAVAGVVMLLGARG